MDLLIRLFAIAVCLLSAPAMATQATAGLPAPSLFGTGAPTTPCATDVSYQNLSYYQTDATNGRLWLCDNSSGAWAWDHLTSPPSGSVPSATATTGTITGGAAIAGSCFPTTPITVNIAGATTGFSGNAGVASAIYATPPTGSPGLLNCTAWVSAIGVMSAQCCAAGILSVVPNFQIKVFMY